MNVNRQWVLAKRPHGMVGRDNFEYREAPIPEPGAYALLAGCTGLLFAMLRRRRG